MDVDCLRRKAAAGNSAAQTMLGISYLCGDEGLTVDYEQAFRLLSAAAASGASRAVVSLARMYQEGLGIPQNVAKAVQLYESVGKAEFLAAIALGRIYANGIGVPVDRYRALAWYSAAAAFGDRVIDCDELSEARAYISQPREI